MFDHINETWQVRKPAVTSDRGVVVSQHYLASEAGARVLAEGGNAVDAAVATAFALGVVEPWMSGIGGGGYLVAYLAKQNKTFAVEFGMKSPLGLNPDDYPLRGGTGPGLFSWPAVKEDRNVLGPYSVSVPGMVAGLSESLARFGVLGWEQVLAPAIRLADHGLPVDWYASLKIGAAAEDLSRFEASRDWFLPGGFVPVGEWSGPLPRLDMGRLRTTLVKLSQQGGEGFYRGSLAEEIVADCRALHIPIGLEDLDDYRPHISEVESFQYRGAEVDVVPGLTAGPTLRHALLMLTDHLKATDVAPDTAAFDAYVRSLMEAYAHRLTYVGDVPEGFHPSHTTHLNVVDRYGNLVALTQTLLSVFGSKVTLPETGILMNNGNMWFDPRTDRPNSLGPGKRPLSNMCPVLLKGDDGKMFVLGASGGRRIMPAVFQLISFLTDFKMDIDAALHHPRVDVSGDDMVTLDTHLPPHVRQVLSDRYTTQNVYRGVYPNLFACPSIAAFDANKPSVSGAAFVMSPVASACAESEI
jgi:gamma-glutamyltranspeptidase/glutathione hydrolase